MMVAKESVYVTNKETKEKFHKYFCRAQYKANELAKEFNKEVMKSPSLRPVSGEVSRPPKIEFLKCHVYEYYSGGVRCGLLVEKYLNGKFVKFSNNNGGINNRVENHTIYLEVKEVQCVDFLHAFSHWVYHNSGQKLLVCDLQGIFDQESRFPKFTLTDPAICSKSRKYGKTDLGLTGLRNFCRKHICNGVCIGLGLPIIRSAPKPRSMQACYSTGG